MRLLGLLSLALTTLGLLALTTACRPPTVPGVSAGTFSVTETLTSNACAGGFDPDATLTYTTDIRVQGEIAYWHRGDTPIASGAYTSSGHFHFVTQQDVQAYGADAGPGAAPGCAIRETETIDGTLALGPSDAGSNADASATDASATDASVSLDAGIDAGPDAGVHSSGFTATDTIQLSIAPGSDCSALFANNGGPFSTLPCVAAYDMTATSTQ